MEYEKFIRKRILELRIQKGVSEYNISSHLGRSKGYIHNISSGKALPSLKELFAIIEYFKMTPSEFFEGKRHYSDLIHKVIDGVNDLSDDDLEALLGIIGQVRLLRGIVNDLTKNQEINPDFEPLERL